MEGTPSQEMLENLQQEQQRENSESRNSSSSFHKKKPKLIDLSSPISQRIENSRIMPHHTEESQDLHQR